MFSWIKNIFTGDEEQCYQVQLYVSFKDGGEDDPDGFLMDVQASSRKQAIERAVKEAQKMFKSKIKAYHVGTIIGPND